METMTANARCLPVATLLADYDSWLDFLGASLQTIRRYERQLAQTREKYPLLSPLSRYLLTCMRQRGQFVERVTNLMEDKAHQLRREPTNAQLIGRLGSVHPIMRSLIAQIKVAMTDIEETYRNF